LRLLLLAEGQSPAARRALNLSWSYFSGDNPAPGGKATSSETHRDILIVLRQSPKTPGTACAVAGKPLCLKSYPDLSCSAS